MGIVIIRILLLGLSFYGYIQFLAKKVNINFTVPIMFTFIGSAMFLSGILNIMTEVAIAIFAAGIALAIKSFIDNDKISNVFSYGSIFLMVVLLVIYYFINDSVFVNYDNYSHWATAVKVIIEKDAFPNFMDTQISFQGYPLGSAAFIYYIVKIIGINSECVQMLAQAMLEIGTLISLFAFVKSTLGKVLTSIVVLTIGCANIAFTDLSVDSLLATVFISAASFCLYYKDDISEKITYIISYMVFLISIKSTGILFSAVIALYLFFCIHKDRNNIKRWIASMSCPILSFLLWQKHVKQVYISGDTTKHALSIENFIESFSAKTTEDIKYIVEMFLDRVFSFNNEFIYILVGLIVVLIIGKFLKKSENKVAYHAVVLALITYVTYQIGLLVMYIFNMPLRSSAVLGSYDRYHGTILMFVAGMCWIAISTFEIKLDKLNLKKSMSYIVMCTLFMILMNSGLTPNFRNYITKSIMPKERARMDQLIAENEIPLKSTYIVLVNKEHSDGGYLYYISKFLFNTDNVQVINVDKMQEQEHGWLGKAYLIVYDTTEDVNSYIKNEFNVEDMECIPLPSSVENIKYISQ